MRGGPCSTHEDGRHQWRYAVSRLAGTPHYGCGPACGIVLPTGDGLVEDAAYLDDGHGRLMITCAACDVWGDVATGWSDVAGSIVVVDMGGDTALCRRCADDPGVTLTLLERYGVTCEGCDALCVDDEVDHYVTPYGVIALCHTCGPDDADTRAAMREGAAAIA